MKKIIDGKRYDTQTALCVAKEVDKYSSGETQSEERLYLTEKQNWFTVKCEGSFDADGWPQFEVLTKEEARHWLERSDEIEALEKYFKIEDA